MSRLATLVLAALSANAQQQHFIIAAGAHSAADVAKALHDDSTAAHYHGLSELHQAMLRRDLRAYVSFRDGRAIYWTARPVIVHAREYVLADDSGNLVRSRCGNRISVTPLKPRAFTEPPDIISEEVPPITPFEPPPITPEPPQSLPISFPRVQAPDSKFPLAPISTLYPELPPPGTPIVPAPPILWSDSPRPTFNPPVAETPEPGTWIAGIAVALGFAFSRFRKRKSSK